MLLAGDGADRVRSLQDAAGTLGDGLEAEGVGGADEHGGDQGHGSRHGAHVLAQLRPIMQIQGMLQHVQRVARQRLGGMDHVLDHADAKWPAELMKLPIECIMLENQPPDEGATPAAFDTAERAWPRTVSASSRMWKARCCRPDSSPWAWVTAPPAVPTAL